MAASFLIRDGQERNLIFGIEKSQVGGEICMKKRIAIVIICVVACICLIYCLDGYIRSEKPDFIISDEETLKKLMSEDNYTIIDIRTAEEYTKEHVIGAVNIPFDEINENVELDKEKTIIVYCQEGDDSSIACTILRELGYGAFDLGKYNTITLEKE